FAPLRRRPPRLRLRSARRRARHRRPARRRNVVPDAAAAYRPGCLSAGAPSRVRPPREPRWGPPRPRPPAPRSPPAPPPPARRVALTSHLPHALANLLVNHAGAGRVDGFDPLAAAAGSLRDMTRVAGANPRIWTDIFSDNAPELRVALAEHRRRVEELEAAL